MCLIVHKPAGKNFDRSLLLAAYTHNPHGAGIMWAENGTIHSTKGLFKFEEVMEIWDANIEREVALHFRYSTRGKIDEVNCHPFQVLNVSEHGRDLYLMHNGTLANVKHDDVSDTFNFVKLYLRPLLSKKPELLYEKEFQEFLSVTIGSTNKILFLDGDGRVTIINRDKGEDKDDCWLSNTYSLQPRKTFPGTYNHRNNNYTGPYHRRDYYGDYSNYGTAEVNTPRNAWQHAGNRTPTANTSITVDTDGWDDELETFFPSRSPRRHRNALTETQVAAILADHPDNDDAEGTTHGEDENSMNVLQSITAKTDAV